MSAKKFMSYGDAESILTEYASAIKSNFTGDMDQWNALSTADKKKYKTADITDDGETGKENTYTTTEQRTGEVWIDGKPIYRKVVNTGALTAGGNQFNHGISNFGTLVRAYGSATNANYQYPVPRAYANMPDYYIGIADFTSTNFRVQVGAGYTGNNAFTSSFVVIEYTKTTD